VERSEDIHDRLFRRRALQPLEEVQDTVGRPAIPRVAGVPGEAVTDDGDLRCAREAGRERRRLPVVEPAAVDEPAFAIRQERLDATAPPLGLAAAGDIGRRQVPWARDDLLCLWTDGLADARAVGGEPFGEGRILDAIARRRERPPEEIVAGVMEDVDRFAQRRGDDRTLVVLRL
jgi:hypothetical protein